MPDSQPVANTKVTHFRLVKMVATRISYALTSLLINRGVINLKQNGPLFLRHIFTLLLLQKATGTRNTMDRTTKKGKYIFHNGTGQISPD